LNKRLKKKQRIKSLKSDLEKKKVQGLFFSGILSVGSSFISGTFEKCCTSTLSVDLDPKDSEEKNSRKLELKTEKLQKVKLKNKNKLRYFPWEILVV